ncbi:NAD(P)-dependent oxidoreductase [Colwellia sp. UCD-KL20]|uniref:NAD(P)-dependent oxidoreductase n=1 Tax=Colwellia sp. UCD-KL20 TaxID=1917165 RepID=UPI00097141BF|nr:NAD(P)-dependent oxidoreductase [Colwellia sp. UCD-KL20]
MKVAFIGLGTMGYSMAGHLQNNGLQVTVFNRTEAKALAWKNDYNGSSAPTPKEAVKEAELVMCCVGNDNDLREVCLSESGILAGLKEGAILIDHTTTSAEVAKEISQACLKQNNTFFDAPVSGGEIGAQNGALTIMVGGDENKFKDIENTINLYAKQVTRLGDVGAGQTCKMVNQLCIAGILQGLSEGLTLAKKSGLDLVTVRDVLKHGAAQSWQLEQRTHTMAEDQFNFGFAIDWMRKDLNICLEQAEQLGINLPVAKMVDASYQRLQEKGFNRCDTSVLIKDIE